MDIRCCYLDEEHKGCEKKAEWGIATKIHETESCTDHVGKLLSDEPVHYVYHLA